jgi:hypothetical protein
MVTTGADHEPKELAALSSSKDSLSNSVHEDADGTTLNSDVDKTDMHRMGKDQQFRVSSVLDIFKRHKLTLQTAHLSSKHHDNVYFPRAGFVGNCYIVSTSLHHLIYQTHMLILLLERVLQV